MTWPLFCHNYTKPVFNCAALLDYVIAHPNGWSYGIYADNKPGGVLENFDESGNGHTYQFDTDITTNVTHIFDATAPGTCDPNLNIMKILDGSNSPIQFIPAGGSEYSGGTISIGAVLSLSSSPTLVNQPLVSVGKQGSTGVSMGIGTDRKLYVEDAQNFPGGVDFFAPELIVPLDEWFFCSFSYNTNTGDYIARFNDQVKTGAFSVIPALPFTTSAYAAVTNFSDSGQGKFFSIKSSYVINGVDDGSAAYQNYLRSIPE